MRPDPSTMSDCHLLDECLTVYRDGGRRHAEIRAQLESRLAACDAARADLREAMELLRWASPDMDNASWDEWGGRANLLLTKHKETP